MINFHQLYIFYHVAKELGYSKAAEKLSISQPSVSIQVQELEKQCGMLLFDRLGKRIYLTEAGQVLYNYAERLFNLAAEMEGALDELRGMGRGRLSLGGSTTCGIYLLPPVLGLFKERFPGVDVNLSVANAKQVQEKLRQNELNVGFIGGSQVHPDLVAEPFIADELVLIVSPTHPFANRRNVNARDLESEAFIMREEGSGTRAATMARLEALRVEPKVLMELGNTEAIKRAVAAGLGVSVVSQYSVIWELAAGHLCRITVDGLNLRRQLSIIFHKDKQLSRTARAFIDFVRSPTVLNMLRSPAYVQK